MGRPRKSRGGAQRALGALASLLVLACFSSEPEPGALHGAVRLEDLGAVRALLQAGVDLDAQDAAGQTALHVAAELGYTPVVQELLGLGADPKVADHDLRTPLHLAVIGENSVRGTSLLLGRGADPNARDAKGRTPIHGNLDRNNMATCDG